MSCSEATCFLEGISKQTIKLITNLNCLIMFIYISLVMSLQNKLMSLIFQGTDCTFELQGKCGKKVEIHSHREIIGNASEVFKTKFDPMKKQEIFVVFDVQPAVFKLILEHNYMDKLPENFTLKLISDMYDTAKQYQFMKTVDDLIKHMINECNETNIEILLSYLDFALDRNIIEVQNHSKSIIEANACAILNSNEFLNINLAVLKWIYSLDDLNIDEWDLIKIMQKYRERNCHANPEKNLADPGYCFECSLFDLNEIRFLACTPKMIDETSLLCEDLKKFFKNISLPNQIPQIFNFKVGRCCVSMNLIWNNQHLKKLYDEKTIKLGIIRGNKYLVTRDGEIKACVEKSGHVTTYNELTPLKARKVELGKKKNRELPSHSVLFYRENKLIKIDKTKDDHENPDHESLMSDLQNLVLNNDR
uniref:CSON003400 protein n=1 Tax=Culicoides sonorensis TaxID=179676 RepID=A0A336MZ67_CULSO